MKTHFIGQEEAAAYALDLARRLVDLDALFPKKWVYVGPSGKTIADELYAQLPQTFADQVFIIGSLYHRADNSFTFLSELNSNDFQDGETVLLIDSAIHTGSSLLKGIESLRALGVDNILTYSLVVKRGTFFVPTYFGVLIDDRDRAIFQLDCIPNNRLSETPPFGTLRLLSPDHKDVPFGQVPSPFEGLCYGDLLYNRDAYGMRTYVYELNGKIAGFVSFCKIDGALFIDSWATCSDFQQRGIGAATLRWAETWGRAEGCYRVELWSYEATVKKYMDFNYKAVSGRAMDLGAGGHFQLMTKEIMHQGDRGY